MSGLLANFFKKQVRFTEIVPMKYARKEYYPNHFLGTFFVSAKFGGRVVALTALPDRRPIAWRSVKGDKHNQLRLE